MKTKYYLSCIFGVVLILTATLLNNLYGQTVTNKVSITSPSRDGVHVGKSMDVKGKATLVPGDYLWVLVHRTKGFKEVWWPQGEAEVNLKTSEWEGPVTFGQARDVGYQFEIAAITVNEREHRRLKEYWLKAMETGDWRPMRMPDTTSVSVTRKVKKVTH